MNRHTNKTAVLILSVFCNFTLIMPGVTECQAQTGLNDILDSIEQKNPVSRMYEADIRSMEEAAKGARSWMPPEIGAGLFMTPYNPGRWKNMGDNPGMGSFMISLQQMIPNGKKLNADEAYMQSMAAAVRERRLTALNELFAEAKKAYYEWVVIEKKKTIVDENKKVLEFMIKDAEIRFRNGLAKLDAYYKAKAALSNIQNMQIELDNETNQRKIILNTLMNRNEQAGLRIDTTIKVRDFTHYGFDSTLFITSRSDIRAIDREIQTNELRMQTERMSLKPQFGIRFDHMVPFGRQPQQFSLMAMVKLPMAPWASRMTEASIESYKWRTEALNSQRQMIINEAGGRAKQLKAEIDTKKQQVKLYENNIIPALRNNFKTILLAYEQNTENLFMLFDAWETLNMTQLEYLSQLQQLYSLQVELEKILQIRQ